MKLLSLLLGFLLCGCGTTPKPLTDNPTLEFRQKDNKSDNGGDSGGGEEQPAPKLLTAEERVTLLKEVEAYKLLLKNLEGLESQVKSKKSTADFFSFALSSEDKVAVRSAELLLEYIKQVKADIASNVKKLQDQTKNDR
jgi:hypothetical protein